MARKITLILVLLLSVSLLLPPSSATNTHFGKKVNDEIKRTLIGVDPPGGGHAPGGRVPKPAPPKVDNSKKEKFTGAIQTHDHN
ncbi:hypothetical protein V6N12_057659 [Hibiscus sabdariffa]|uniref:Transmembrane protein n=1 Tax=Hibiscus sabdariffa TaxID=183260 RepID=A0ABR2C5S3_9ROSI